MKAKDETEVVVLDTTIGDLICAICEATSEATRDSAQQQALNKLILIEILRRRESAQL